MWGPCGIFGTRFGHFRDYLGGLCDNFAINYGLGVVGQEMAMDFGSANWNGC